MMHLHRIREIETKLYSSDFALVDFYSMKTNEELLKYKERLFKERQISMKLNKPLKQVDEIIEIVELVMEKNDLQELVKAEEDTKKGTVIA